MDKKYNYIQVPLCLVQKTFEDTTEGWDIISSYGIVNYGKKFNYDIHEVARQLIYSYYRNKDMMQKSLYNTLQNYIDEGSITLDEDNNGFNGADFNPETKVESLLPLFESDTNFKDASILRWQIDKAAELLNVSIGSIEKTISRHSEGKSYHRNFESKYGPDCWLSVKPSQIFEFRDSGKDLDLFRVYLGIKSIIGHREFNITHKSVIICRMFGCKSEKALREFLKVNKTAKVLFDKYSKRYWTDWLLTELENRGFITKISYPQWGIFISTSIKDKKLLAEAVIKNHKKKDLAKAEKSARQMILQHIHETAE